MSDEQEHRVGLNEALFRQVNEEIRGLTGTFRTEGGTMTVVCECDESGCTDQIEVKLADYERIRGDSCLYIVAPGHEIPDLETVVEENDAWTVVRKREGAPAEVARETDSRS